MSAAAKINSKRILQRSSPLKGKPISPSETRPVRVAKAVPTWQVVIPANVMLVAARYAPCNRAAWARRVPWRPARGVEHVEEPSGHGRRLHEPEPAPRAFQHRPVYDAGCSRRSWL